jgi:hypothetical protein
MVVVETAGLTVVEVAEGSTVVDGTVDAGTVVEGGTVV